MFTGKFNLDQIEYNPNGDFEENTGFYRDSIKHDRVDDVDKCCKLDGAAQYVTRLETLRCQSPRKIFLYDSDGNHVATTFKRILDLECDSDGNPLTNIFAQAATHGSVEVFKYALKRFGEIHLQSEYNILLHQRARPRLHVQQPIAGMAGPAGDFAPLENAGSAFLDLFFPLPDWHEHSSLQEIATDNDQGEILAIIDRNINRMPTTGLTSENLSTMTLDELEAYRDDDSVSIHSNVTSLYSTASRFFKSQDKAEIARALISRIQKAHPAVEVTIHTKTQVLRITLPDDEHPDAATLNRCLIQTLQGFFDEQLVVNGNEISIPWEELLACQVREFTQIDR